MVVVQLPIMRLSLLKFLLKNGILRPFFLPGLDTCMVMFLPEIFRSSAENLLWVAQFASHGCGVPVDEPVILDFSGLRQFDGNLLAALGVLVSKWKSDNRCVCVGDGFADLPQDIQSSEFFKDLPFFSAEGGIASSTCRVCGDKANPRCEALPYRKFSRMDSEAQADFVTELFKYDAWPKMTESVRDALVSCILELFSNAQEHSESEQGVFACGCISSLNHRMLYVTIADAGIGFRVKIENVIGNKMKSSEAIDWGMTEGNTVRQGNPGGLGLKILKEFIVKNDGMLSILSDCGYWELASGQVRMQELDCSFPGTVVTVAVNMDDPKSYRMVGEVADKEASI